MEITNQSSIPLFLPGKYEPSPKAFTVLAGDVGGTKTNLAFCRVDEEGVEVLHMKKFASADFHSCVDILHSFIEEHGSLKADKICLGVAGPVIDGKVDLTNLNWFLDVADIRRDTGVKDVALLNDLEAIAYGLAGLRDEDFTWVHKGRSDSRGNMAIIAPGTGLGEAGLYWDGRAYHPFPTEGGHCDFSPRTELDMDLYWYMQKQFGVVSWEKVVAGPAIHEIYLFLRDERKRHVPGWLAEAMETEEDPSRLISETAMEDKAAICVDTMNIFIRYLAREASNLVMKMKATGGLFLGGGIPPKISALFQKAQFYTHYMDCDRMQHLLETVPIRVINNDKAAVIGAACYGAYGDW